MNLRDMARGMPCYFRLIGCKGGGETVVLCHIRRGNVAGVGQKPSDLCALPGCDHCHGIYDGRTKSPHSRAQLDADALRGLCQWLSRLEKEGVIRT